MSVLGRIFFPGGERTRTLQLGFLAILAFLLLSDLPEEPGQREGALIFSAFLLVWSTPVVGYSIYLLLKVLDTRRKVNYVVGGGMAKDAVNELRS